MDRVGELRMRIINAFHSYHRSDIFYIFLIPTLKELINSLREVCIYHCSKFSFNGDGWFNNARPHDL